MFDFGTETCTQDRARDESSPGTDLSRVLRTALEKPDKRLSDLTIPGFELMTIWVTRREP